MGAFVGWGLSFFPFLRRWVIGRGDLADAVSLRAAAEFTRHGVMNTQDRCGVLLLVSLFEHRAHILADRGIHAQVPEGYWKECLDRMMAKVKPEGLSSALCSGITELGALLAEKFPREAGSTNELADHLRQDG
jgi:putative membrane protein